MRTVIEFRGLTLESYIDFRENIKTRVNRIVAGPPVVRSQQLLALIDAGIVSVPFGPLPAIQLAEATGFVLRSKHLERPHSEAGGLAHPRAPREPSALPLGLEPAHEPLARGQAAAAHLRRDGGRQRRPERGIPPDQPLGPADAEDLAASAPWPRVCATSPITSPRRRAGCGRSSTPSSVSNPLWADPIPLVIASAGGNTGAIEIAFVNNMPDSAFEATEQQFIDLLERASAQTGTDGGPPAIRASRPRALARRRAAPRRRTTARSR